MNSLQRTEVRMAAARVFKEEVRGSASISAWGCSVEQAKLIDQAKSLNTLLLDAQLVTAIKRGAAKGDIRAIQMGYQRLGLMRDGEFLGIGNA